MSGFKKAISYVDEPLVSIIMNCFNSDTYLKEAIESVYSQTYKNWEIIFWDNASNDNSPAIAKSYDNKLKYFFAEENTNLGTARKLAMRKASGKYIAFLDCDDLFLEEKLENQVSFMEENDYVMSYGSTILINESGEKIRTRRVKNTSGYIFDALLNHYEIFMQSVMIRKSLLEKEALYFDKKLIYNPDYNLFMKIASKHKIGVLRDYLIKYRFSPNSLSNNTTSIASIEMRHTLDEIFMKSPELKLAYKKESKAAYDKAQYYEVVSAIYKKDKILARKELERIMFSKIEYLILYLLLSLPISSNNILKILGR